MDLKTFNLTTDERSLLIEMTDFGVPLYELISDIKYTYPNRTSDEQLQIAKKTLLSVIEKDLARLCKLTNDNTENNVYLVSDSTALELNDVKQHISQTESWTQSTSTSSIDNSISFEIAPTELGEEVLDEIFRHT